jgi:AraC family transcriptional activator of pyochelin receptor
MQIIDLSRLLDVAGIENLMPPGAARTEGLYQGNEGVQFRSPGRDSQLIQEIVRLADGVFLLASDYSPEGEQWHRQIVDDSDWLHIQLRLRGGGCERISEADTVATPEKSCVISRYPKFSMIDRKVDRTPSWRAVCLLATPRGLTDLMGITPSALPDRAQWMIVERQSEPQTHVLPLLPALVQAANDVLSCSFPRDFRHLYLRAKSLELLSIVLQELCRAQSLPNPFGVKLSAADLVKLSVARTLITEHLESTSTLAELAQRVGLNRTKLALGFKEVYGTSVQSYWRDLKLNHARELLRGGSARVTEVALSLGYSDLSSFTRAFSRKFGVLPRECREHL